ncbi:MAG: alpha/beta hydrolase [Kiritimatiellales bacterium]|nr:alpha/beta hydrolase [Kiritimatiellales bacterium]
MINCKHIAILALFLSAQLLSAQEMPVLPKGKKPQTFRELKEMLKPLGFDIKRPELAVPKGMREHLDVTYAEYGKRELKLDLLLPKKGSKPCPLVILIHGGGWKKGSKEGERAKALWLVEKGYAAAAIEYRLSGEARFPAAIHDCKAAIRWLRSNAGKHGYDPDKIAVFGGSAGAHLAALTSTAGKEAKLEGPLGEKSKVSSTVQAAIVVSGPTDITSERVIERTRAGDENYLMFIGGSYDDMPAAYKQASPATWVGQDTPPMFIIGENSIDSAEPILAKLAKQKIANDSLVLTGAIHGSWNWDPWFSVTMNRTDQFLRKVWKLK